MATFSYHCYMVCQEEEAPDLSTLLDEEWIQMDEGLWEKGFGLSLLLLEEPVDDFEIEWASMVGIFGAIQEASFGLVSAGRYPEGLTQGQEGWYLSHRRMFAQIGVFYRHGFTTGYLMESETVKMYWKEGPILLRDTAWARYYAPSLGVAYQLVERIPQVFPEAEWKEEDLPPP